jgi:molybdopterin synthase sulfur carrier subunit
MRLTLKYFAALREALGPGEALEWTPSGEPTAAALRAWLSARSNAHARALAPARAVRVARRPRCTTAPRSPSFRP